jgi:hypothetical protein
MYQPTHPAKPASAARPASIEPAKVREFVHYNATTGHLQRIVLTPKPNPS